MDIPNGLDYGESLVSRGLTCEFGKRSAGSVDIDPVSLEGEMDILYSICKSNGLELPLRSEVCMSSLSSSPSTIRGRPRKGEKKMESLTDNDADEDHDEELMQGSFVRSSISSSMEPSTILHSVPRSSFAGSAPTSSMQSSSNEPITSSKRGSRKNHLERT